MAKTPALGTKAHTRFVNGLARAYASAIRAEEDAPTIQLAYRRAAESERALRRLQAARAGLPLPEPRLPRTAKNMGKAAIEALATIGRSIARALSAEAALRRAHAANAISRAARAAAKLARLALRRAAGAIARLAMQALAPAAPAAAAPAPAPIACDRPRPLFSEASTDAAHWRVLEMLRSNSAGVLPNFAR